MSAFKRRPAQLSSSADNLYANHRVPTLFGALFVELSQAVEGPWNRLYLDRV
jgi:hypothetical protein